MSAKDIIEYDKIMKYLRECKLSNGNVLHAAFEDPIKYSHILILFFYLIYYQTLLPVYNFAQDFKRHKTKYTLSS